VFNHEKHVFFFLIEDCFTRTDNIPTYKGTLSTTISGLTCQRWDKNFPQIHVYDLGSEHNNYCRNPSGDNYIWCLTTDPFTRWEACGIQECVTGKSVTVHGPYVLMHCYCNIQECVTGKLVTVHGQTLYTNVLLL